MRYLQIILLAVLLFFTGRTAGQQAAAIDSIKAALAKATTAKDKVYWLDNLSRTMMNVDPAQAELYGKQVISVAEESRDRELMVDAYMSNGLRCTYFAQQKEFTRRAIEYYEKALELARKERLEKKIGAAQLRLAVIYLTVPDKDKALSYVNQASSLISILDDDSLKVESHNTYGLVYLSRNEKTLSLRHYLNALRLAEEIKADKMQQKNSKAILIRNCFVYLANFYGQIEDYEKAIDYQTLALKKLDEINEKNVPYQRVIDMNTIGNLFAEKKNYDIAISYFERSLAMADSLKFSTLKIPGYISLINQYMRMEQPQKALDYLQGASGDSLKAYLGKFGFSGIIDQAYASIYTELNQFDTSRFYLNRAISYFEKNINENIKISFYGQLAKFYKKTGDTEKAIEYYLKVKEMGEKNGMLENVQGAAKNLDTLYARTGNMPLALQYNAMYHQYKDSIGQLNREKELAQVEAADEQQRQERILKEKEELKRRKNNIQYMAITFGIVILFITLIILGMFKVSAGLIKAISFFVFLMLFEFIFLVFKKNIYSITHGEPWKDLAFMIALAALLVPLHHWLEHKVLHYLTSHNRLTSAGHQLKRKLFRRTNQGEQ